MSIRLPLFLRHHPITVGVVVLLTAALALLIPLIASQSHLAQSSPSQFAKVDWHDVIVADPRDVGEHSFVSKEGDISSFRLEPDDIERVEYHTAIIVLVRLKDGSLLVPDYVEERPRFGAFGRIVYRNVRRQLLQWSDNWSTPISFPVGESITGYALLMRSDSETTGWRLLELNPDEISEKLTIAVPDLLDLPRVSESPDEEFYRSVLKIEVPESADE